jgi:large-conductance mechanosensitive channel
LSGFAFLLTASILFKVVSPSNKTFTERKKSVECESQWNQKPERRLVM